LSLSSKVHPRGDRRVILSPTLSKLRGQVSAFHARC